MNVHESIQPSASDLVMHSLAVRRLQRPGDVQPQYFRRFRPFVQHRPHRRKYRGKIAIGVESPCVNHRSSTNGAHVPRWRLLQINPVGVMDYVNPRLGLLQRSSEFSGVGNNFVRSPKNHFLQLAKEIDRISGAERWVGKRR